MKGVKVRIYPNREQRELLDRHFGACRFVYNAALELKQTLWKEHEAKISWQDLVKQLKEAKEDQLWLSEVKAEALQQSIRHLDSAYQKFFKGAGYPRFKSRRDGQSFTQTQSLRINGQAIVFMRREIKFKCSKRDLRDLQQSCIRKITWSKDPTGKYWASLLVDHTPTTLEPNSEHIGIDLGLKEFIITSDGEVVSNPRYLRKAEQKLKRLQRSLSRKRKGSQNRKKVARRVAVQHQRVAWKRRDFHHKLSKRLIDENQVICLESLNISGMMKNHALAKSVGDAAWGSFVSMLQYKAKWYGREVRQVGRFEPTSKKCSSCGWKHEGLTLAHRTFNCQSCGLEMDRDLNAAINIKNICIGMSCPEYKPVETEPLGGLRSRKSGLTLKLYHSCVIGPVNTAEQHSKTA